MNIYNAKHRKFRNAVIQTMRDIATISTAYDDLAKRQEFIDISVDSAFNAIVTCFDNELYETLTDTTCRRYAKSEIFRNSQNNSIDNILADDVFEDLNEMLED